jgi:hypothetical protein
LFAVPPSLVRRANHLFGGYKISYTLGCGNGALPSRPTRLSLFGLRLPGPFSFRFRRRLTPAPTLCAWLETYYSCSSPFGYSVVARIIVAWNRACQLGRLVEASSGQSQGVLRSASGPCVGSESEVGISTLVMRVPGLRSATPDGPRDTNRANMTGHTGEMGHSEG